MSKHLLTVSEFAEHEKVSKQAIYQRLRNESWRLKHSLKVDGKVKIDLTSFDDQEAGESKAKSKEVEQGNQEESKHDVDDLLKEIQRKDSQIAELREQILKLERNIDDLTDILRENQRSASMLQLRILQIESKDDPAGADQEQEEQKGFFVRIRSAFKRS